MTFDITIPVLNEEATLAANVGILHRFLLSNYPNSDKWKIVIADNGSSDDTRSIAESLSLEYKEVIWLSVPRKGVGLALKTSWGQSKADVVGYMDLDLATDLQHFPEAYDAILNHEAEVVYGSRLHAKSHVINRTFKREVASRVFNLLLKTYLGVSFSDGMCGFKFLKRDVYHKLLDGGAQNDGWFFSTELLTIGEWQGRNIHELPIKWTDDAGSSKVKIIPLAKRYIQSMIALKKLK